MKLNPLPLLIGVCIAALLAFTCFVLSESTETAYRMTLAGMSFLAFFSCGTVFLSKWDNAHHGVNARAVTSLFFVIFAINFGTFAFTGESIEWLVIVSGLLLLVYLLIVYSISNLKM